MKYNSLFIATNNEPPLAILCTLYKAKEEGCQDSMVRAI
jgi:hypothetical protein